MFFALSKIAAFFISPSNAVIFLMTIGVALLFTRYAKTGRRLTTLGLAALLIMAATPLGGVLMVALENRFPPPPQDAPPPDGIVVLGGAMDEHITAARGRAAFNEAGERLIAFVELARRYPQARLVFSGGSASLTGVALYRGGRRRSLLSRGRGSPPGACSTRTAHAILGKTPSTRASWRDPRRPSAGSSSPRRSHMPRAMGIFRQVGFPATAFPVDYRTTGHSRLEPAARQAHRRRLAFFDAAAHEWIGLAVYHLTGKTDALFPAP